MPLFVHLARIMLPFMVQAESGLMSSEAVSMKVDFRGDLQAEQTCSDTDGWTNIFGSSCAYYAANWCQDGDFRPGSEWTGSESLGAGSGCAAHLTTARPNFGAVYSYPARNCCECGKGKVETGTDSSGSSSSGSSSGSDGSSTGTSDGTSGDASGDVSGDATGGSTDTSGGSAGGSTGESAGSSGGSGDTSIGDPSVGEIQCSSTASDECLALYELAKLYDTMHLFYDHCQKEDAAEPLLRSTCSLCCGADDEGEDEPQM